MPSKLELKQLIKNVWGYTKLLFLNSSKEFMMNINLHFQNLL